MNGILGMLRLDRRPLDPATLDTMQGAMAYWGRDGAALWRDGPLGLGCQLNRCTPEPNGIALPYEDQEHGWVLTAGAFLDNRTELLEKLRLPRSIWSTLPDTLLIHRAYARWGEACVHHLSGDWHFALWDRCKQRLFVARDHDGISGLYYVHRPTFFAFASSRKTLLSLPELSPAPNLLRMAQLLTCWAGDGTITAHEGILRLPPAHHLTLESGSLFVKRYWFAEETPLLHLPREEDYLDGFFAHYRHAVQARLRANSLVGTTLSGGLDSGSVSVLAAAELEKHGQALETFTAVPLVDTTTITASQRFGNESEHATATAEHAGNITRHFITAEKTSPLRGIECMLEIQDEPNVAAANHYWIVALLEAADQRSIRTLLTGQGGNATVSWSGGSASLWPFFIHGTWRQLPERFWQLKKRQNISALRALKRFFIAPLIAPLRGRMQYGLRPGQPPFLSYSAIHPGWARSLDLFHQMKAQGHDPRFSAGHDPLAARHRIIIPGRSVVGAFWAELGGAFGLEVRDPTMDKRLMEFCLGIPNDYHFAEGMNRAVIRRAFKGLLPDKVRLNQRTGLQAADIGYRIANSLPEMEDALRRMERHFLAREVLDLPKMWRVLDSIRLGVTRKNTVDAVTILLRGIGVGLFLLRW